MQTLYTFGYLSSKAERIFSELIALRTPIVDIRFHPDSHNWRYKQESVAARPGIYYVYIKELGNEWYKEALTGKFTEPHIKLHAPDTGLEKLQAVLNQYQRAAIFCACASKTTCHRSVVAELARTRLGVQIVHL